MLTLHQEALSESCHEHWERTLTDDVASGEQLMAADKHTGPEHVSLARQVLHARNDIEMILLHHCVGASHPVFQGYAQLVFHTLHNPELE